VLGFFPKAFSKRRQHTGGRALRIGWARGPSAMARTDGGGGGQVLLRHCTAGKLATVLGIKTFRKIPNIT